jgi:hypothetical protein
MKMVMCLRLITILGLGGTAMLCGCALVKTGDRFWIGISRSINQPKLEYGVLVSDDKMVRVDGVNAGVNYGASNGTKIPNEIEFIWRAVGEKTTHLEKINLRSQIPNDVLEKISGVRPRYIASIEFFVHDNVPRFRWRLTEALPGQTSDFKIVRRSENW